MHKHTFTLNRKLSGIISLQCNGRRRAEREGHVPEYCYYPPSTPPATTNLPCSIDLRRQALDFGFAPNPSWAQSVFWADYNQSCFLPSHCDSSHHKETNERACNICAHTTRIQKSGAALADPRIYICAHTSTMQFTTRIRNTEYRNQEQE